MKVAVTGANGFVGSALVKKLRERGHEIFPIVRDAKTTYRKAIVYDPQSMHIQSKQLAEIEAVIHLGGENLFGPWTRQKRKKILDSRVDSTRLLAQALLRTQTPRTFLCASAIGFYGDRGDELITEASPKGTGFLSRVCQEWEAAAKRAEHPGMRVVNMRLGVVLDAAGGALAKMLPAFKLGFGGKVGSGKQYTSWISREDLVDAILFLLENPEISGPVNLVAPEPVTNAQFTQTLAQVLKKPGVLTLPAFALKLALGQMAEEVLLASTRVVPGKLQRAGFQFKHPSLAGALRATLRGDRSGENKSLSSAPERQAKAS